MALRELLRVFRSYGRRRFEMLAIGVCRSAPGGVGEAHRALCLPGGVLCLVAGA